MTTNPEARPGQAKPLLDELYGQDRVVITASLKLTNGHFLQPTGFPDIDACVYRDKEGRRWCLVESEQSMANRLEAVSMKSPGVWVDHLKGLPLIAVKNNDGDLLATNLTEPHRIASSYVLEGAFLDNRPMGEFAKERIGVNNGIWPLNRCADLEKFVFALDPGALLHGFQFIDKKFFGGFVGLRQVRLLHARLEAELPEQEPEVHYQMVKFDQIEQGTQPETNKGQSIAAKSRLVPKEIVATFEIDVLGLKGFSFHDTTEEDEKRKKLLLGLGLWKVGSFLANKPSFDPRSRSTGPSLRHRADCYLTCESISWSGNSATGATSTTELMGAKPTGLGVANGNDGTEAEKSGVNFGALLEELLSDKKDEDSTYEKSKGSESTGKKGAASKEEPPAEPADDKKKSLYDGPLVEVTYEPKPKKEKQGPGKAQEADANAVQADEQQG
jgi:CRISPR-associated protein Csb1